MKLKIIGGTYGWRDAEMRVHPVKAGETCEVEDTEGARLCSLGVAIMIGAPEAAEEKPAASRDASGQNGEPAPYDRETLEDMKLAGLRMLCESHGAAHPKKMTKAECIAFLLGEEEPDAGEGLPDTGGAGEIVI